MYGAAITIGGAVITIVLNIVLIPKLHYAGAALATFCCYLFMMICSYLLGQKYYRVPYAVKKLLAYLTLSVLLYFVHLAGVYLVAGSMLFSISAGIVLFLGFTWFVTKVEAKELAKLPVVGKYFNR